MSRALPFLIWGAVTLVLFGVSGGMLWLDASFRARSVPAEGVVTHSRQDRVNGELRTVATVTWKDREGTTREYTKASGYVGARVSLRYDPRNPEDVRSANGLRFAALVPGFIGIVFFGILIRVMFFAPP